SLRREGLQCEGSQFPSSSRQPYRLTVTFRQRTADNKKPRTFSAHEVLFRWFKISLLTDVIVLVAHTGEFAGQSTAVTLHLGADKQTPPPYQDAMGLRLEQCSHFAAP